MYMMIDWLYHIFDTDTGDHSPKPDSGTNPGAKRKAISRHLG